MPTPSRRSPLIPAALLALASPALAGGSPENALIIINPASHESMYLGNYYKNARNIPDRNVLYIDPAAADYAAFSGANGNLDALFGTLRNAALATHIDYIVVAGTDTYFVSAPGYVSDGCWPVTRFSQSSVYTMAYLKNQILAGNNPVSTTNHYSNVSNVPPQAFSSRTAWLFGNPSTSPSAARYFIGAQLGFTPFNGNTIGELLAMIDRSVAADGSRPAGTFYFMNTTDPLRNVRSPQFPGASSAITAAGGVAVTLNGVLPDTQNDCLGVMTGWADPGIDASPMTLLPGAFCDHLTSWAATFNINEQTKVAAWIRKGASGSAGEVEEPCNYTGKFPSATFHANYFKGLSLGEAWLRSVGYVPFQGLLYGDPLTRPFATFPTITPNTPAGVVSGRAVAFTPSAATALPGATIAGLDLFIDGVYHSTRAPGQPFSINTLPLADGPHELRILAYDNTPVRNTGRWIGTLTTDNFSHSASINLATTSGDLSSLFQPTVSTTGGTLRELRLLHNGRVIAASTSSPATLSFYGRNIGAGVSRIQAQALFTDGTSALSQPVSLNIAYNNTAPTGAPVAYSYTKHVARGGPFVVELPGSYPHFTQDATYTLLTQPSQGTTVGDQPKGYRVMTASPTACGQDQFTFRITTPAGVSNTATVTLIYGPGPGCPADYDESGQANVSDFIFFQNGFAAGNLRADIDGSCSLNINDFIGFLNAYALGCP